MSLLTQLASDFEAALNDWGEQVNYYQSGGSVPGRNIAVVVDRNPEKKLEDMEQVAPVIHITAKNDPLTGIWSGPVEAGGVNTGGDEIEVALRYGGDDTVRRPVVRIVGHDPGCVTVEVR